MIYKVTTQCSVFTVFSATLLVSLHWSWYQLTDSVRTTLTAV